ncbi:MAG: Asp-tRNA(Asn)/Glu-tRNA(Gln) amidotransferase GatCAB subunit A, partial [Alphaproteobacteria bacterium]|nr:Asp-tRNA(Asn)/Glu-tRNA(Gln) amidotransferase GatCAB subunit A [Alphaproteobacteria bacterium]
MSSCLDLTAVQARAALAEKKISATELTQAYLDAAAQTEALNAYTEVTAEKALAMAKASDERIAAGNARPLEGIPVGVKDLFCTKGVETTACSNILNGYKPVYESTVTQNLWNDGAVMLGKLNCDEFAMGSANE